MSVTKRLKTRLDFFDRSDSGVFVQTRFSSSGYNAMCWLHRTGYHSSLFSRSYQ